MMFVPEDPTDNDAGFLVPGPQGVQGPIKAFKGHKVRLAAEAARAPGRRSGSRKIRRTTTMAYHGAARLSRRRSDSR